MKEQLSNRRLFETKEGFKGMLLSKSHPQGDLRPALRSPRNATSDGESWALERRAGTWPGGGKVSGRSSDAAGAVLITFPERR